MKWIESWTGPGCNFPRLHQKEIGVINGVKGECNEEPLSTKSIGGDV